MRGLAIMKATASTPIGLLAGVALATYALPAATYSGGVIFALGMVVGWVATCFGVVILAGGCSE